MTVTLNGGVSLKERAQNASSRALSEVNQMTFNLSLEFLNKCEFHCSGCYVNRRNNFSDADLANIKEIGEELSKLEGAELNEVIVGPTDFFATENVEILFEKPEFLGLFDHFKAITITSTLMSNPRKVAELMEKTLNKLPKDVHLELFVSLDVERLIYEDIGYIQSLENNLRLLSHANILFIFNMHKHPLFENYAAIAKMVNERFNSHLKMNPSFFRGRKSDLIKRELTEWKKTIEHAVGTDLSGVLMNVADDYFGGSTYVTLAYKQRKLYVSPCFYDYVFDEHPMFEVGGLSVDSIFNKLDNLTINQYEFAEKTVECLTCPLLSSCVSKKVLATMEQHDITECLMPKDIILKMTNR